MLQCIAGFLTLMSHRVVSNAYHFITNLLLSLAVKKFDIQITTNKAWGNDTVAISILWLTFIMRWYCDWQWMQAVIISMLSASIKMNSTTGIDRQIQLYLNSSRNFTFVRICRTSGIHTICYHFTAGMCLGQRLQQQNNINWSSLMWHHNMAGS